MNVSDEFKRGSMARAIVRALVDAGIANGAAWLAAVETVYKTLKEHNPEMVK